MGVGFQPEVGLEFLCPWFFLCFELCEDVSGILAKLFYYKVQSFLAVVIPFLLVVSVRITQIFAALNALMFCKVVEMVRVESNVLFPTAR